MPSQIDRTLAGALTVSLLTHVALIVGPAWELPDDSDQRTTRIEARLTTPTVAPAAAAAAQASLEAAPGAAPAAKPRPKLRRKPARAVTPRTPAASLGSPPSAGPAQIATDEPAAADAAAEPAAAGPAPAAADNGPTEPPVGSTAGGEVRDAQGSAGAAVPGAAAQPGGGADADVALPRSARIAFSLILANLQVGEALQTWQRDERGYQLRIVMETTGAARLFKALTITQTSAGELDAGGLKPQSFIYEQTGRNTANSTFDWAQMKLTLEQGDNRKEFPLEPGAQDLLSLAYQLGFAQDARQTTVAVASGKNYYRHTLEWVGEESVTTPAGEVRAIHVRTVGGDQTTEFWVAPQLHNLPVRIMFTDRKGTATQLIAHEVEADGTTLLRRPETNDKK